MNYPILFTPIEIGNLKLSNRIVIAPMAQYSSENGQMNDWHLMHLGQLANSGAAALTIEGAAVSPEGRTSYADVGLYADETEAAMARVLHGLRGWSDVPIGIQLNHAGRKGSRQKLWNGGAQIPPSQPNGWKTYAPSPIAFTAADIPPVALDRDDLAAVLKLNDLALFAFTIFPITLTAQAQRPLAAQTETSTEHSAQVAAIEQVEQVMSQYHAAILAHDGTALAKLFLPDASLWLNVLTDSAYARARAKSATAQKVRVGNCHDFAKLVSTTTKSFDPEHSNVVIHTDGTIAAVYFDFVFNVDGNANNHGSETWQLVKAADGWRIASIVYSSEPPAQ